MDTLRLSFWTQTQIEDLVYVQVVQHIVVKAAVDCEKQKFFTFWLHLQINDKVYQSLTLWTFNKSWSQPIDNNPIKHKHNAYLRVLLQAIPE